MKKRSWYRYGLILFLLVLFSVRVTETLREEAELQKLNEKTAESEAFREQEMDTEILKYLSRADAEERGKIAAVYYLEKTRKNPKILLPELEQLQKKWNGQKGWEKLLTSANALWNDIQYFPIPESVIHPQYTVAFEDSWMSERSYGGKRGHEGCDIMAGKDVPGLYPVISMTDGVVSARGWLEKGGYRIGIEAPSGGYFYYAHLDSYGSFQEGDEIKAGDILGFMGNSGYGKEGTTGMFATHLHIGIYLYPDGKETSYNPYWILKLAGEKKLSCSF